MTDDDLDTLLATPLADMADAGFSARVMARVRQVQKQRDWLVMLGPALALLALVPFLPLDEFTHAILGVTPVIANSAAISLALGVLILTFTLDLRLRE
jgi:uncharacterized membrane protein (DUF485 family)